MSYSYYTGLPKEEHYPVAIFVESIPGVKFLHCFREKQEKGQEPFWVVVILSDLNRAKKIINSQRNKEFIQNGLLNFLHITEWEKKLSEEIINIRSVMIQAKGVISASNCSLALEVGKGLIEFKEQFCEKVEQARKKIANYYESQVFQSRLQEIATGLKKPRVYFEKMCYSIAVKRFTDACEKTFKELGCDTFLHKTCSRWSLDMMGSTEIEIDQFKPDLIVRTPNLIKGDLQTDFHVDIPILYSLQDVAPHFFSVEALEKVPLKYNDLLYFILPEFLEKYKAIGVSPKQMICENLPPPNIVEVKEGERQTKKFDVYFMKSMFRTLRFRECIQALSEEEKLEADSLEERLREDIKNRTLPSMREVINWVKITKGKKIICSYVHALMSAHIISSLVGKDYKLGLSGKNWDRYLSYRQYALGHVESTEGKKKQVLESKIHLSMNPFAEFHQRIFEGGSLGAFFLIYQVSSGNCCHPLPKEMIPGIHFDYFADSEELHGKIKYYLEREDLREKIGRNLQKLINEKFSCKNLCSRFLNQFQSLLVVQESKQ